MDKDNSTILGVVSSAVIGATVYPDAADLLKIIIPLIAGALAPTVKDLFSDLSDYFREKILKLKPRKKEIEDSKPIEKNIIDEPAN